MKRAFIAAGLVILLATGCGGIDVTDLLEYDPPTRVPELSAVEDARAAPAYAGPAAVLRLEVGGAVICDVADASLANTLLDVIDGDIYRIVDDPKCGFDQRIYILDDRGTRLDELWVASDGCRFAVRSDGKVVMIPEHAYYALECALWSHHSSFSGYSFPFQLGKDSDTVIEMQAQKEIPALLWQRFGYADGYFSQIKLYGIEEGRSSITAYAMVTYALYTLSAQSFSPWRKGTVAIRIVYDKVRRNEWQIGSARISEHSTDKNTLKNSVRGVLTFEFTQQYMEDIKDTSALEDDILIQAREYLRVRGMGRLPIDK